MKDATRAELIQALVELGEAFPDWRFGQLVANVATAARPSKGRVRTESPTASD